MTDVEFHTGVPDSIAFACRLLRKACRQGVRVQVTAPAATLADLDRALWQFDERDFVPHVLVPGARPAVAARTPIWLTPQCLVSTADAAPSGPPPEVVVNLGADAPADVARLQRLIEIVSDDPDEADRGRARWRAYKAAGLAIKHHAGGGSHVQQ